MKAARARYARRYNLPTVEALAEAFAAHLFCEMGGDQIVDMMKKNAAEEESQICHSHDYVDANMVMHDAINELCGTVVDHGGTHPQHDKILALWNDAWVLAKRRFLTARPA